jgi:hypothetical protein
MGQIINRLLLICAVVKLFVLAVLEWHNRVIDLTHKFGDVNDR